MASRRNLLVGAAVTLAGAGAVGTEVWWMGTMEDYDASIAPLRRTLPSTPDARDLIRLATLAANSHNTQARPFRLDGDSIGFHLMFFAAINPIAPVFAAFFVFQAVLLLASAVLPADLRLRLGRDFRSIAGLMTLIHALAIYPVLGVWAGHGAMAGPMFGIAPCPITIFSIGLLLMARGRWVIWLSIIPVLWSLIALAAAIQLGIPEDLAMPVAGAVLAVVMAREGRSGRAKKGI